MRFSTTGQELLSMVKEYMSKKFIDSLLLVSPGISILSPGLRETVCVQKQLSSSIDVLAEDNHDSIL